jgi:allantoinase
VYAGVPENARTIITHLKSDFSKLPYDYSPAIQRKKIVMPNDARIALWVVPNIELWVTDIPAVMLSPSEALPDIRNYGWRDYSLRSGIWRMMNIMDKHNIRGTVALNSGVCTYFPQVIEECKKRSWEFMGHGISNSWTLSGLSREAERGVIQETVKTIKKHTGKSPEGWLSPGLTETKNTLGLLAENGIKYVCDWCNDEQPYRMRVGKKELLSVPYSMEIHDLSMFLRLHFTPKQFYEAAVDNFDALYEEGATDPKVMCIALHPFVIGQPFRAKYLDKLFEYILQKDRVWVTTGGEIADWYSKNI